MKKTLFLSLALGMTSAAVADVTYSTVSGRDFITGTGTITGDVVLGSGSSTAATGNDATNLGSQYGNADVTLAEGASLTTPNALFIAGVGYGQTADKAGDGVLHMSPGSQLIVGGKTTSSGGCHVDVGNSKLAGPCTGELYMDNASLSACQLVVGNGKATGYMEAKNGSVITLELNGKKAGQQGLIIGYSDWANSPRYNGTGTLVLDNSTFRNTIAASQEQIGTMGSAKLELKNGAVFETAGDVFVGDAYEGAYNNPGTPAKADISIDKDSSVSIDKNLQCYGNTTLANAGKVTARELYAFNGASLDNSGDFNTTYAYVADSEVVNSGTLTAPSLYAYTSSIDNSGTIKADSIVIGESTSLITGLVSVTGCEVAMHPEHTMVAAYNNGLQAVEESESRVYIDSPDGDTLTIGARVESGDAEGRMQYVYTKDLKEIDATIRQGLNLYEFVYDTEGKFLGATKYNEATSQVNLNVAHILGKSVTANVTTDDACHGGAVTVALDGSHLVVRVGEEEGSVDKVGTLGSYNEDVEETAASVRVNTAATGSTVAWEGSTMKTVAGETATLAAGNTVKVGREATEEQHAVDGTLTVVGGSTLDNQGTIDAKTVVEQGGTLKGSGSLGTTDVHGNLVVGNSPGAPTFAGDLTLYSGSETVFSIAGLDTPATATLNGWESATYSQISITDGSLTLENGACFTIEFGGALLSEIGGCQDFTFDVILVRGGDDSITLDGAAMDTLRDNTELLISPDVLAGGAGWSIEFDRSNLTYSVQDNGSTLHLAGKARLVPEPATATLSLLTLAALAARRRRK